MSEKEEDYLKAIYKIVSKRGFARSIEIAEALGVKPASVTDMLKKLQDKGLIIYEKYRGVLITSEGEKIAKKLLHRAEILIKFFRIFGVQDDNAEKIAHHVEHYIEDSSFQKIEKFVEFVDSFSENPRWIEHFRTFIETGKLPECDRIKK